MKTKSKSRLLFFLLITIGFSWILWIPKALITHGIEFPKFLEDFLLSPYNPAAFGPLVGALIATYLDDKFGGVKTLLKKGINFKFKPIWYFVIFFMFPAITFASLYLLKTSGTYRFNLEIFKQPLQVVYWFFWMLLLGGPLQEEFGWRGYALDKLQEKHSAFWSSIILGIIWLIWHLPLYFIKDAGTQYSSLISVELISMMIGTLVTMIIMSIIFTWVYNNTNKSVLATLILHTTLNLSSHKLFPIFESPDSMPYFTAIIMVVAILIVLIWGGKTLSKNRFASFIKKKES